MGTIKVQPLEENRRPMPVCEQKSKSRRRPLRMSQTIQETELPRQRRARPKQHRRSRIVADHALPAIAPEARGDPARFTKSGFSVSDLCRRWKVGPDKIRGFLRRGELIGINLATNLSARPQWRITPESVDLFERRRSSGPAPKRLRKRKPPLVDYYPGE